MSKVKGLAQKDLLGLREMTVDDINLIVDTATSMKEVLARPVPKVPALLGKSICLLFYEASTRTRTSFDSAAKVLSANTTNIAVSTSSVVKGETLIDTAKNIEAMGHQAIVIRHNMSGAPHLIAKNVAASVINAGDGFDEHPTQGLLDIFTMVEKKGPLKGKKVVIVDDVVSTGRTIRVVQEIMTMAKAETVGAVAVLKQGEKEDEIEIPFTNLGNLPLFQT